MRRLAVGLVVWVASSAGAQQLAPSEELKVANAPFQQARAQPNDLTEADQFALGVGVERASKSCGALTTRAEEYEDSIELLALARLCIFGQRFDDAAKAAIRYLATPTLPERETAILLLAHARLGSRDYGNAQVQAFTLMHDYPYDPRIHYTVDQVVEASGLEGGSLNSGDLELCGKQLEATLPLLESGKGLADKDVSAGSATLFTDAVRCLDLQRALGDPAATETLTRLGKVVSLPAYAGSADLLPMRSALARTQAVGAPVAEGQIAGKVVRPVGPLLPRTLPLARGSALLVPFTVWVPNTITAIQDFPVNMPDQTIYLLTSWAANSGSVDEESPEILLALRKLAQELPKQAVILVVPDAALQALHADAYPGVVVVRNGVVEANAPLEGEFAKRLAILRLGRAGEP